VVRVARAEGGATPGIGIGRFALPGQWWRGRTQSQSRMGPSVEHVAISSPVQTAPASTIPSSKSLLRIFV
jgi:hypothetical protein